MTSDMLSATTPSDEYRGRTVLVAGACGKLGRVICYALHAAGANIVINDVKSAAVEELVASFNSPERVLGVALSATQSSEIISQTIAKFQSIHALVLPILGPVTWNPFPNTTDEDFRVSFENNVVGPLSLTRAAWPYFVKQRFGRVVNFTSDGMLGFPTGSTYVFSKGALLGVNKTLAMEGLPHNIHINCVSPIAFLPHMERHIAAFSPEVRELFWKRYTPEANVPIIMALVSERCVVSGEVFCTAGNGAGRMFMGYVEGENEMRTVNECLEKFPILVERGTRVVFEPLNQMEFTKFQAQYMLK